MTTVDVGRRAEMVAADFLQRKGFAIVAHNWRTRWCEIDVIALRDKEICFCEVKYRKSSRQGTGIDYITPQKLRRMRFAAESWVHAHRWLGHYYLAAIEVSGVNFQVTQAVKDLG